VRIGQRTCAALTPGPSSLKSHTQYVKLQLDNDDTTHATGRFACALTALGSASLVGRPAVRDPLAITSAGSEGLIETPGHNDDGDLGEDENEVKIE